MEKFNYFKFCEEVHIQAINYMKIYNKKPNRVIIPLKWKNELENTMAFVLKNNHIYESNVSTIMGMPISWDYYGNKLYVGYMEESNYVV